MEPTDLKYSAPQVEDIHERVSRVMDLNTEERQNRLRNSQPLHLDWSKLKRYLGIREQFWVAKDRD
jgi:hypothetical protein